MNQDLQGQALYKIGEVERLTGLTPRRIRYYETQGLIHADRTEGKQRLYTAQTVERLRLIKSMIEAGHSLSGIKTALQNRPAVPRQGGKGNEPAEPPPITSLYPVRDEGALMDILLKRERGPKEHK